jgi:hypothetical protein
MAGFDFSRPPHPKAMALISPLISGVVFLAGIAYYRSDLRTRVLEDPNLNQISKLVLALVISYGVGLLLSFVISGPFFLALYFGGYGLATVIMSGVGQLADPSMHSTVRRAAQIVLGSSIVPPSQDVADIESRVAEMGAVMRAQEANLTTELRDRVVQGVKSLRAMVNTNQQWDHVYKALYQIETRRRPAEEILAFEPVLSIAAAVLVWCWGLSYDVPSLLRFAAIATFVISGIAVILLGSAKAFDYYNGISVQALLFEETLKRRSDDGGHSSAEEEP